MSDFNSSLPVRTEAAGDVIIKVCDATVTSQQLAIDSTGKPSVKLFDGTGDAIESINSAIKAAIQDSSGNPFSSTNPLFVTLSDLAGTAIDNFSQATAIAAGATSNHDYTVTAAKTFFSKQIQASASGKMKIEAQWETGAATGVFVSFFVGFNSTAEPNILIPIPSSKTQVAGAKIRVIRTNTDNQAQNLYSTISGNEE